MLQIWLSEKYNLQCIFETKETVGINRLKSVRELSLFSGGEGH
jgi:hypothetical protein